jgi:TolB-like protein
MHARLRLWIPVLFVTGGAVLGSIGTEDRLVVGSGRTPDEAVINGLIEAIRQVRGLEVDVQDKTRSALQDISREENGQAFSKTEIADEVIRVIRTRTRGVIDSYEILAWNETHEGGWEGRMRVSVAVYTGKTDPNDRKPNLAIMPIRARPGLTADGGLSVHEIARQVTHRLTARIVQSQHFHVLDREYGDDFERERQLLLSANAPVRELARFGEQLGADYLLTGMLSEVHSASTWQEWHGIEVVRTEAVLAIDVRVVEFATRQVLWADNVTVKLSRIDRRPQADGSHRRTNEDALNRYITTLVDDASIRLNQGFLDILVPIRVLGVLDGKVYLNQGSTRFTQGEQLAVLGPPSDLTDPDTGALIRIEGRELAKIVVKEIMNTYSIADILNGKRDGIKAGLPCKRLPCAKCGGSGTVRCEKCDWKGEAVIGIKSVETRCAECNGSGKKQCPGCNGTGKMRLGPVQMETCLTCNGTRRIKCESCAGTGIVTSDIRVYDRCRICGGSKTISCPLCRSGR